LCSESLPSTKLMVNQTRYRDGEYNAGGVTFKMVTPMSRWKIGYQGKMYLHDDKSQVHYLAKKKNDAAILVNSDRFSTSILLAPGRLTCRTLISSKICTLQLWREPLPPKTGARNISKICNSKKLLFSFKIF